MIARLIICVCVMLFNCQSYGAVCWRCVRSWFDGLLVCLSLFACLVCWQKGVCCCGQFLLLLFLFCVCVWFCLVEVVPTTATSCTSRHASPVEWNPQGNDCCGASSLRRSFPWRSIYLWHVLLFQKTRRTCICCMLPEPNELWRFF